MNKLWLAVKLVVDSSSSSCDDVGIWIILFTKGELSLHRDTAVLLKRLMKSECYLDCCFLGSNLMLFTILMILRLFDTVEAVVQGLLILEREDELSISFGEISLWLEPTCSVSCKVSKNISRWLPVRWDLAVVALSNWSPGENLLYCLILLAVTPRFEIWETSPFFGLLLTIRP